MGPGARKLLIKLFCLDINLQFHDMCAMTSYMFYESVTAASNT